jgi:cyclic beta-1,2-glucan synthetase
MVATAGVVREPAAAGGGGRPALRVLRGGRLHARAAAARRNQRTIRSFMAHHQGMSLLALILMCCGLPMQRRFLACPLLKAADLLLQERVPRTAASVFVEDLEPWRPRDGPPGEARAACASSPIPPPAPEVHLLSNGRYHVVISSAGGGYSRWRDLAVTRWREDATRDCWGTFVYLRDVGDRGSSGPPPTTHLARDERLRSHLHAGARGVPPAARRPRNPHRDQRVPGGRRGAAAHHDHQPFSVARVIELTSYAEVVLAPRPRTRRIRPSAISSCRPNSCPARPPCSAPAAPVRGEKPPWLLHLMVGQGGEAGAISCETDRSPLCGPRRNPGQPRRPARKGRRRCPTPSAPCSIPSSRCGARVTLPPHETVVIDLVLGVTESREPRWRWWKNTRTPAWPTARSIWRGRTAR